MSEYEYPYLRACASLKCQLPVVLELVDQSITIEEAALSNAKGAGTDEEARAYYLQAAKANKGVKWDNEMLKDYLETGKPSICVNCPLIPSEFRKD